MSHDGQAPLRMPQDITPTPEQLAKIEFYTRLVLDDNNSFNDLNELRAWIDNVRSSSIVTVTEKPINELDHWSTAPDGSIHHSSGEFFSIIGVHIEGAQREVASWDQPLVRQREAGILGILVANIDGVDHYLLNAKAEPGNTLLYQISPTLQATYSNLKTAHGGHKPKFAEYFVDDAEVDREVLYRRWLAEDGGRFYLKSNLNMLVRVDATTLPALTDDFKWFTLSQIKAMLLEDDYINPHVRGILCHL